jgi:hypothetical protein
MRGQAMQTIWIPLSWNGYYQMWGEPCGSGYPCTRGYLKQEQIARFFISDV